MENFSENKNNNLENKGWDAMRILLDNELPEAAATPLFVDEKKKENKRRFLIFFLLFLGLICTGLGYYFYAQNSILNKPISTNENNKTIAIKNDNIESVSKKNFTKNDENTEGPLSEFKNDILLEKSNIKSNKKTDNSIKYDNGLIKNSTLQNLDNQVVTSKLNIKSNIEAENKSSLKIDSNSIKKGGTIERNYTVCIDEKKTINDTSLNKISSILNQEKNTIIEENKTQNEGITKLISITDLIEILTPKLIYFDDKIEFKKDYFILEKINKLNSKNWSYGLILGLNTEGPLNTLGGVGGVFLEKNLSAKWSINTGLNYRFLSKNVANIEYLQTAADVSNKATTSTFDPLVKVNKAYLQNLSYLELPIQINHHFNRKLSVFSGAKIGYLVSQNISATQTDNAIFVSTSSVYGNKDANRIIDPYNYTSNDLGLQKWDIGWIGGVNYRLNQRFSMQLRYDLGITNIYQTGVVGFNNRFLGLNVAYGFKGKR
jgi:hypothetical protein